MAINPGMISGNGSGAGVSPATPGVSPVTSSRHTIISINERETLGGRRDARPTS